jgi:hypothetical protein
VRLGDFVAELAAAHNAQEVCKHQGQDQPSTSASPLQDIQAVAVGPSLDRHGGIAITPDGMLHLAVTKDMYQQLGLPGKESPTQTGK